MTGYAVAAALNRPGADATADSAVKLVSTGRGRTTCGYFTPDGQRLIYASTHLNSPDCPPPPNQSEGYVWAIYPSFDIFSAKLDGTDIKRLTNTQGYDAEGTIAPASYDETHLRDPALHALMRKCASLQGIFVGSRAMFERMNAFIEAHHIKPVVDRSFEIDATVDAFRHHGSGAHFGKIVIRV